MDNKSAWRVQGRLGFIGTLGGLRGAVLGGFKGRWVSLRGGAVSLRVGG